MLLLSLLHNIETGCSGHVPLYTFPFMVIKRKLMCSLMVTVVCSLMSV